MEQGNRPTATEEVEEELPATEIGRVTFESESEPEEPDYTRHTKKLKAALLGNVVLMGFAFMLNFTAFYGLANLQSTLNAKDYLGILSLVCHYITSIVSNLLLPSSVIRVIGCKRTIIISLFMYLPYASSQFYVAPYTIIPAAIFSGIGTGPLWVAASIYLITMSKKIASVMGYSIQNTIWNIIGIFYMIIQASQILGNGITAVELMGSINGTNKSALASVPYGKDFCFLNESIIDLLIQRPNIMHLRMLITIFITCIAGASLIIFFLVDSLTSQAESGIRKKRKKFKLIKATIRLLKRRDQLEFIPLTIFLGCTQAFISSEFNEAFVGCVCGVEQIGFVMMCYGGTKCLSAITAGFLVRIKGGAPIFISVSLIHTGCLICLLTWEFKSNEILYPFVMAGFWGLCDGAWLVGVNAMYGILFPNDVAAAYSNFRLWEAFGYALGYSNGVWLCINIQLYFLIGLLVIGMAGYIDTEFRHQKVRRTPPQTDLSMQAQEQ